MGAGRVGGMALAQPLVAFPGFVVVVVVRVRVGRGGGEGLIATSRMWAASRAVPTVH